MKLLLEDGLIELGFSNSFHLRIPITLDLYKICSSDEISPLRDMNPKEMIAKIRSFHIILERLREHEHSKVF